MNFRSFKFKLISSYLIVILIPLALIAFFLDRNLEENSLRGIEGSLVTEAKLIENQILRDGVRNDDFGYLDGFVKGLSGMTSARVTVIDVAGKVLADSEKSHTEVLQMENHRARPEVMTAAAGGTGIDIRRSPTLKIDMLYAALPIKDKGTIIGTLRLALTLESVEKTLSGIRKIVLLGILFAIAFAFILGYIMASKAVKPINKMIHASRSFSQGDFKKRIDVSSRDEIGGLASTLNGMAQDIENKVKEISSQNQELAAIFNSMVEGIIVVDRKCAILSVNPAAGKIFGISAEGSKGKQLLEVIRNNDAADIIKTALEEGRAVSDEADILYPVRKVFEISAMPVFENNAVVGCVSVIHDITEMRKLETIRKDFVANVSHELKTPLTSIRGFVETLLDGALDDKENSRAFLKIVQDHAGRLDTLVNDLLILSNLESQELTLKKEDVALKEKVERIASGFGSQMAKKRIVFNNNLPSGLVVKADADRIGQVLTNLIDNAIKFNKEKGSITIYSQDAPGKIKIIVEDSGMGIPEKDIFRIFERFYRVDKARSREMGGTGLGLSIVKHIIELHNGSVGVESTEGLGSKFWFTIPK